MARKFWNVTGMGVDEFDVRFDKQGCGFCVAELIEADTEDEALAAFFDSTRVRKVARQNGVPIRELMVHAKRSTIKAFVA